MAGKKEGAAKADLLCRNDELDQFRHQKNLGRAHVFLEYTLTISPQQCVCPRQAQSSKTRENDFAARKLNVLGRGNLQTAFWSVTDTSTIDLIEVFEDISW